MLLKFLADLADNTIPVSLFACISYHKYTHHHQVRNSLTQSIVSRSSKGAVVFHSPEEVLSTPFPSAKVDSCVLDTSDGA